MASLSGLGPTETSGIPYGAVPPTGPMMPLYTGSLRADPVYSPFGETQTFSSDRSITKSTAPVSVRATVCEYPVENKGRGHFPQGALRTNALIFAFLHRGVEGVSYATSMTGLNRILLNETFVVDGTPCTAAEDLVYDPSVSCAMIPRSERDGVTRASSDAERLIDDADVEYLDATGLDPNKFGVKYACPEDVMAAWGVIGSFVAEQKLGNTGFASMQSLEAVRSASRGALNIACNSYGRTSLLHYGQDRINNGSRLALQLAWTHCKTSNEHGMPLYGRALQFTPFCDTHEQRQALVTPQPGRPALCSAISPVTGIPSPMITIYLGYVVDDWFDVPRTFANLLTDPHARGAVSLQIEMDIRETFSVV